MPKDKEDPLKKLSDELIPRALANLVWDAEKHDMAKAKELFKLVYRRT
jgi:hypothetical protein